VKIDDIVAAVVVDAVAAAVVVVADVVAAVVAAVADVVAALVAAVADDSDVAQPRHVGIAH
jgi:hypothetical protein